MSDAQETTWDDYYKAVAGRAPRLLFLEGLARFEKDEPYRRQAVDLGCGDGTETFHLLQNNWRVLAVDQQQGAVTRVRSLVPAEFQTHLETQVVPFEDLTLPPVDFIYAGFSLPFCRRAKFNKLWAEITSALRMGGRFAGQLFGVNDTWATNQEMTFHSRGQVEELLGEYEVELFREEDEDGRSTSGPKHWHVFHVIAQKK